MLTHRDMIADRGGIRPLARALGHKNPSTVQGWWERNNIPPDRVAEVAAIAPQPTQVAA